MTNYESQIQKELEMARIVQDSAMPREIPETDNLEVAAYFQPARFIGGDFIRFMGEESKKRLGLLIGDVCGKGVPAALIMAVVFCLFKEKSTLTKNPAELMSDVNVSLKEFLGAGSYFNSTAFWGVFNISTMNFSYANAGHNFPLHYCASTDSFSELPSTGTLLGIFKESQYSTKTVKIGKGDRLYFYSDGLLDFFEALYKCEDGYIFLKDFFLSKNSETPANIIKELAKSVDNSSECATDDITLTVVQIK